MEGLLPLPFPDGFPVVLGPLKGLGFDMIYPLNKNFTTFNQKRV
ncbi:hypothetical protein [Halarcobacter sp.]|nr:hypothetical protein [Halarcobacter sp.]